MSKVKAFLSFLKDMGFSDEDIKRLQEHLGLCLEHDSCKNQSQDEQR